MESRSADSSPELLLLRSPAPLGFFLQIPEAWLLLANVVVLLILVPVKDHLLDPLLLRCKLLPSALQKMALGMFFGFTSVIVAGAVWGLGEWDGLCLGLEGGWFPQGLIMELWVWAKYTLHLYVPIFLEDVS